MTGVAVFAVSTVIFDGLGLLRGAGLLAGTGVTEVEPAFIDGYMPFDETTFTAAEGRRIAALFADHGIAVPAISAHTDLGLPDSADRLARRLDLALGAGAGVLVTNATSLGRKAALMRTVEAALPRFQSAGVVLALENPGHGQDALLPDGKAGAALVAGWDSPWLRLNYDVGNAYTYAQGRIDLADDIASAAPCAARVHLKDVALRGGDWQFCPLGEGAVGYGDSGLLRALRGMAFTCEHPIRLWRPGRGDPVRLPAIPEGEAVRRSIAASARAFRAMGLD